MRLHEPGISIQDLRNIADIALTLQACPRVSRAHVNAVLAGTELPSKQLLDALCLEDRGNGTYAVKGT